MANTDANGDNDELQALFDSISSESQPAPAAPAPAPAKAADTSGDSDDLQALFDSIVTAQSEDSVSAQSANALGEPVAIESVAGTEVGGDGSGDKMFEQIGHMTRQLFNTLRELGYDRKLEAAVQTMPDARDRLLYIANMTAQAAERALNATEVARPLQEKMENDAKALSASWQQVFDQQMDMEQFKALVHQTRQFLGEVPKHTHATNSQLTEIMMAQDFQDLTGQVIKKVIDMAQTLEQQLLQLLLTSTPAERRPENADGLLNGPVINAEGRTDVVSSQDQVDELLESLGF